MFYKSLLLFTFIGFLWIASCKNEPKSKSPEDILFKQVMRVHDEVMPKMKKVNEAKQRAQLLLDTLASSRQSRDSAYALQLQRLIQELDYASFVMDTWMGEFQIDKDRNNQQLRMKYLESELEKVTVVKTAILNSLSRADSLIRQP